MVMLLLWALRAHLLPLKPLGEFDRAALHRLFCSRSISLFWKGDFFVDVVLRGFRWDLIAF
jgi:hypothetical protein